MTRAAFFLVPDQLAAIRRVVSPLYFGEVPIILWLLFVGARVPEVAVGARESLAT